MVSLPFPEFAAKRQSRIAPRLVFFVLITNAILSLISASMHSYIHYERSRAEILASTMANDSGFKSTFETALWTFNYEQIDMLLSGVMAGLHVKSAELRSETGQDWVRGTPDLPGLIPSRLELSHTGNDGTEEPLGVLVVGISLAAAAEQAKSLFWTLMVATLCKMLIASILMLAIFDLFVSRHLRTIAAYVSSPDWVRSQRQLEIPPSTGSDGEEIEDIRQAINTARERYMRALGAIETEAEDRKRAERELRKTTERLIKSNQELSQLNREQAQFTYALSHDLKSPTNTVSMLLDEFYEIQSVRDAPEAMELVCHAKETTRRMSDLVEGVLKYSRSMENRADKERIEISQMMEAIRRDLHADLDGAGATLHFGKLPAICGYPMQIRMLFQNLLSNAIKFRSAGATPKVTVLAERHAEENAIRISVSDNGIGIDKAHYERIFTLFQRLHTYEEYPGAGLGLALCWRVMSNHGGSIEVQSEVGSGTTFTCVFPIEVG
ncbi:MAG: ATP-binding protein [Pseudomonadota bacterium]